MSSPNYSRKLIPAKLEFYHGRFYLKVCICERFYPLNFLPSKCSRLFAMNSKLFVSKQAYVWYIFSGYVNIIKLLLQKASAVSIWLFIEMFISWISTNFYDWIILLGFVVFFRTIMVPRNTV